MLSASLLAEVLAWSVLPLAFARFQVRGFVAGLWIGSAAAWLTTAHFALLGGSAGAITALAVAITITFQALFGARFGPVFRYGLAVVAIAVACALKEPGAIAFLPIMAFAATRLAEASRHDLGLRLVMLVASLMWIFYAAAFGSLAIALGNGIGLGSGLLGLWRFYGPLTRRVS